jgi:hypothetical protein
VLAVALTLGTGAVAFAVAVALAAAFSGTLCPRAIAAIPIAAAIPTTTSAPTKALLLPAALLGPALAGRDIGGASSFGSAGPLTFTRCVTARRGSTSGFTFTRSISIVLWCAAGGAVGPAYTFAALGAHASGSSGSSGSS